jgi:hypothetical protein
MSYLTDIYSLSKFTSNTILNKIDDLFQNDVEFKQNVVVDGNLTVNGTTVSINTDSYSAENLDLTGNTYNNAPVLKITELNQEGNIVEIYKDNDPVMIVDNFGNLITSNITVHEDLTVEGNINDVTVSELGNLKGTNDNIQSQLDNKQNILTAGSGINISSDTISVDESQLSSKQNILTAGSGINISGDVISVETVQQDTFNSSNIHSFNTKTNKISIFDPFTTMFNKDDQVRMYPPVHDFTYDASAIEGRSSLHYVSGHEYGNGTYKVTMNHRMHGYRLFSDSENWSPGQLHYGGYIGSGFGASDANGLVDDFHAWWVTLELPDGIFVKMSRFEFSSVTSETLKIFKIYGSKNGIEWDELFYSRAIMNWDADGKIGVDIESHVFYKYFGFALNDVGGKFSQSATFGSWYIYGYEGSDPQIEIDNNLNVSGDLTVEGSINGITSQQLSSLVNDQQTTDILNISSIVLSNTGTESIGNLNSYESNLLVRYNFDGNLTDSSANSVILTGTPGTFETENEITSLKLSGDTSDPLFCNVDLTGNKTFSISLWFKKINILNNDTIISTDKLHTYGGIALVFGNNDGGNGACRGGGGGGSGVINLLDNNGKNGLIDRGGNGGKGVDVDITGVSIGVGGGGPGSTVLHDKSPGSGTHGAATRGGGRWNSGHGDNSSSAFPAVHGTGGGGGGGGTYWGTNLYGGSGGNGRVVIRWVSETVNIIDNDIVVSQLNVLNSSDYYYSFESITGTNSFTITKTMSFDILMVGGGGAGGYDRGGGGGGGRVLYYTSKITTWKSGNTITLEPGTYNVIVGKGADKTLSAGNGKDGESSIIKLGSTNILIAGGGAGGGAFGENGKNTDIDGGGAGGAGQANISKQLSTMYFTHRGYSEIELGNFRNFNNLSLNTNSIDLNNWTHLTVVYDTLNLKKTIYKNGINVSETIDTTTSLNFTDVVDGNYIPGLYIGSGLIGNIRDLRIYDIALTNDDIYTLFGNAIEQNLHINGGISIEGNIISKNLDMNILTPGSTSSGGAGYQIQCNRNGNNYQFTNTTNWSIASDKRIKTEISEADYKLCYDNINKLSLNRYKFIDGIQGISNRDKYRLGYIAQDVEKIFPKNIITKPMTIYDNEQNKIQVINDCLSIDTDQIQMSLYGAFKHMMTKIEDLEHQTSNLLVKLNSTT